MSEDILSQLAEDMNKLLTESAGSRRVPFSRVLYIEQDDFRETPPPKYFRLSPGREVRLRWACIVKCERVVKDPAASCGSRPRTTGCAPSTATTSIPTA